MYLYFFFALDEPCESLPRLRVGMGYHVSWFPACLALTHSSTGFWKGLGLLLLVLLIGQMFGFALYFMRTSGFRHPDIESVYFVVAYLKASGVIALVCYPLGFYSSRWATGGTRF